MAIIISWRYSFDFNTLCAALLGVHLATFKQEIDNSSYMVFALNPSAVWLYPAEMLIIKLCNIKQAIY